MGRARNQIEFLEQVAVMVLRDRLADQGLTLSAISERSGVGRSRLSDLFRSKTSCTVTDFERLCSLVGERPSRILEEAELYAAATSGDVLPDVVVRTWRLARLPEESVDLVLSDVERELEWAQGDSLVAATGLRQRRRARSTFEDAKAPTGAALVDGSDGAVLPPVWELAASDHGGWEAERREREGLPAVEPEDESQVLPDDVD